jgi:hypothetical protein
MWPAFFVGLVAVSLVLGYKKIPKQGLILLITIGVLDFLSSFFFGFTSLLGLVRLSANGFENQVSLFPAGIIPLFLVPYAITYHMLSFINLKK